MPIDTDNLLSIPRKEGSSMRVEISKQVHSLLDKLGEREITIEFSLQFGSDLVKKDAIAYPGAAPDNSDFQQIEVDGVRLWWRQRISTGWDRPAWTTTKLKPRRVKLHSDGFLFEAHAQYS